MTGQVEVFLAVDLKAQLGRLLLSPELVEAIMKWKSDAWDKEPEAWDSKHRRVVKEVRTPWNHLCKHALCGLLAC